MHMKRCSTSPIIKRNANKNYNEITPDSSQNSHQKVYNLWKRCGEQGTSYTTGGRKAGAAHGPQYGGSSGNERQLPSPLLGINPDKTVIQNDTRALCSQQHYS